jgi:transcriptional regulator with XRE-family HTH domain
MEDSLTSMHIRAGRALLGWSIRDLAEKINVHRNTISNYENERTGDPAILMRMKTALEAGGVEFLYGDRPGVRLSHRASNGKK